MEPCAVARWNEGRSDAGNDPAEQVAHPGGCLATRLEDFLVVEGLTGDACGEVGDQADPQHLEAGLARGDRLERRAHPDQVAADGPDHADLGRGLVVRPGELHRSEEHTAELQSLMRISYDVF